MHCLARVGRGGGGGGHSVIKTVLYMCISLLRPSALLFLTKGVAGTIKILVSGCNNGGLVLLLFIAVIVILLMSQ